MNVIARPEYELANYDSAVHRFNHYTTRTPPSLMAFCTAIKRDSVFHLRVHFLSLRQSLRFVAWCIHTVVFLLVSVFLVFVLFLFVTSVVTVCLQCFFALFYIFIEPLNWCIYVTLNAGASSSFFFSWHISSVTINSRVYGLVHSYSWVFI